MRVHRQELRRVETSRRTTVEASGRTTDCVMFVRNANLTECPHHLLNVVGASPPPYLEHAAFLRAKRGEIRQNQPPRGKGVE